MNDHTEEGRLVALTRDILGAKGLLEIAKGLLDSLTPERRSQLAESLIMNSLSYDVKSEVRTLLMQSLTDDSKARLKAEVEAQLGEIQEKLVKELVIELKDTLLRQGQAALRRW